MRSRVFTKVRVSESRDHAYAPKPTMAILDSFETLYNTALPPSFRAFALDFGAGELAGFYRIYTPLSEHIEGLQKFDLGGFNKKVRMSGARLEEYTRDIAQRLLVFCSDGGGTWYAWDIGEKSISTNEYIVYELENTMRKVADSFEDFVKHCCQGDYWTDDDEKEPLWQFTRFRV